MQINSALIYVHRTSNDIHGRIMMRPWCGAVIVSLLSSILPLKIIGERGIVVIFRECSLRPPSGHQYILVLLHPRVLFVIWSHMSYCRRGHNKRQFNDYSDLLILLRFLINLLIIWDSDCSIGIEQIGMLTYQKNFKTVYFSAISIGLILESFLTWSSPLSSADAKKYVSF